MGETLIAARNLRPHLQNVFGHPSENSPVMVEDENEKLMAAVCNNEIKEVKKLIESGIDINCSQSSGRTALMFAAAWGYLEIVEYLIKQKANLNAQDEEGNTPLIDAVFLEGWIRYFVWENLSLI